MPPLRVIEPEDVTGAEAEVYGVLKSTRNPEQARAVINWVLSEETERLSHAWRKKILCEASNRLFMIDSAKAVAEEAVAQLQVGTSLLNM